MLSPQDIVYTGIFLNEASKVKLLEKVPAIHQNVFAHHVTVKYRPSSSDIFKYEIGKEYELEVVGVVADDKGQAVVIKDMQTEAHTPHITISTSGEIKPNYSNDLLKSGHIETIESFTIRGTYGFYTKDDTYLYEFPSFNINHIQIPTRFQPDTLIALFLLNTYASDIFKNISTASFESNPIFPKGESFETLLAKGTLAIDFEQSIFDHHSKKVSSVSEAIAIWCNIEHNKEVQKLLEFAKRSEEGKGTVSNDALDKMFGLDGLIMTLNRVHDNQPKKVYDIIMPVLSAHHQDIFEKTVITPRLWEELITEGKAKIITCKTNIGNSKIAFVESDSQNLPGYVRSYQGERCDLFVQRLSTGHVNLLSKANNNLDLAKLAGIIRQAEALVQKRSITTNNLREVGRIESIPEWYYDTVTNSVLNGGRAAGAVTPTHIPWKSFEALVKKSFE